MFILVPILLLYYESNENEAFLKRIWNSVKVQLPMFLILILIITVSYFAFRSYQLNSYIAEMYDLPLNGKDEEGNPVYEGELDFSATSYVVLCWLGMILFSIFGGVGIVMMPYDYF